MYLNTSIRHNTLISTNTLLPRIIGKILTKFKIKNIKITKILHIRLIKEHQIINYCTMMFSTVSLDVELKHEIQYYGL